MKKPELIATIAEASGQKKQVVEKIINLLVVAGKCRLSIGEEFTIAGLVKMKPVDVPARAVRNPKTGETVQAPARVRVKAKSLVKL